MKVLEYNASDNFNFSVNEHNFVTIMGSGNKKILDDLLFKKRNEFITYKGVKVDKKTLPSYRVGVAFVLNEHLDVFTSETVEDELAYSMENLGIKKSVMHERIIEASVLFDLDKILESDPSMIGSSKKAVIKIVSCIFYEPKVIVLDNILSELDKRDKKRIINFLIDFVKKGGVVLNFTSDIEDSLYGNYMILTTEDKIAATGRTLSILNEEKLMNRLGLSLPFKFDLNKQLMYYDLVKDYVLDEERLVDAIWK